MIKTIDRYVARQYVMNFAILVFVLMSLFVLFDLINDMDEFIKAGRARSDRFGSVWLGTLYSAFDYYGPMLLLIFAFLSGLLTVAAMGFTYAQLIRHRELIALTAGGVSLYRVAGPVLVVGGLISMASLIDQEWLVPQFAGKLARSKSQIKYDAVRQFAVEYAADGKGNLLSAERFDAAHGELEQVTILIRDEQNRVARRLTADQARWDPYREGWELIQGYAVERETVDMGAAEPQPVDFFATDLSPTILMARRASIYPRLLSSNQLRALANNPALHPKQARAIRQVIWGRFSLVVVNILVLAMCLPLFLTCEPINLLNQGVKAAGVSMGAWIVSVTIVEAGVGGLNPVTTAWLPVAILLPVTVFALQRIRT
ncbi:MAG: LptF/LptG family permease [Phycisphaeraceae bacterium]|nr:LptF/LptG family permease [Phycisphaeraceae bacterium]